MVRPTQRPRRARGALTAGALALAIGAFAPGEAQAYSNGYCGVLISSGSWCGDGSGHTYDYNRASYGGSGSVWVCERMLYDNTYSVRSGNFCATNFAARNYGYTTQLFEAEVTHSSGVSRHTISGYATA